MDMEPTQVTSPSVASVYQPEKRSSSPLVLLVIMVIVFFAAGGYYLGRMMAWQRYINQDHGFEIELPAGTEIVTEGDQVGSPTDQIWNVQFKDKNKQSLTYNDSNFNLIIQITSKPKDERNIYITNENFLKGFNLNDPSRPKEQLNLQGRQAVKESYASTNEQGKLTFNGFNITYYIFDAEKQQLIHMYGYTHDVTVLSALELEKILSSFKFL